MSLAPAEWRVGHGVTQQRCACCPRVVVKANCPYPLDPTMRWCAKSIAREIPTKQASERGDEWPHTSRRTHAGCDRSTR
jgi:hypothetical protein